MSEMVKDLRESLDELKREINELNPFNEPSKIQTYC